MFWPFTQATAGLGALYILHMAEHALLVETLLSEIVGEGGQEGPVTARG